MYFNINQIVPIFNGNSSDINNPTYNVANNTFSFTINGVTTTNNNSFRFQFPSPDMNAGNQFGDNLTDGTIDPNGSAITFPNLTTTPKNFRVDLIINFNGSGTYTITQI